MVQGDEIREQLADYLAGELSLASFERWLNSSSVPLIVDADDEAFRLAAKINLLISERHDHVISERELRNELIPHANRIVVTKPMDVRVVPGRFVATSASQWVRVPQGVVA